MPTKSIYLANGHGLMADGLSRILNEKTGIHVDRIFKNSNDLFETLRFSQPDLLIFNLALQGLQELHLARQILDEYQEMKILLLAMKSDCELMFEASKIGVCGMVTMNAPKADLYAAIDCIMLGENYFEKSEANCGQFKQISIPFTKREYQVLNMLSEGFTTKNIAEFLCLSEHTVESHRKNLLMKASCKNSTELLSLARYKSWI